MTMPDLDPGVINTWQWIENHAIHQISCLLFFPCGSFEMRKGTTSQIIVTSHFKFPIFFFLLDWLLWRGSDAESQIFSESQESLEKKFELWRESKKKKGLCWERKLLLETKFNSGDNHLTENPSNKHTIHLTVSVTFVYDTWHSIDIGQPPWQSVKEFHWRYSDE